MTDPITRSSSAPRGVLASIRVDIMATGFEALVEQRRAHSVLEEHDEYRIVFWNI